MKHLFLLSVFGWACVACAADVKHDVAAVRAALIKAVGDSAIAEIRKKEGGEKFLKAFLADRDWMEQFLGSGRPGTYVLDPRQAGTWEGALKALDLLVWNDKGDWISNSKIGKHVVTAFALNHGTHWSAEKIVQFVDCYREWDLNGTLDDSCYKLDTWGWREVVAMGQNKELPVEALRWIHDFANVPPPRHYGICWSCSYRLFNCFGASVHGSDYYRPWQHRWNTQELRYRVGGVCGALSKYGSHCAASHGIRSYTAGQPGHCAFMLWDFSVDRWGIAYAVTSHTGCHFSLGGSGFPSSEEQDRYYRNPKRLDAEYLRLKGDYTGAMAAVPGNWNAAYDWLEKIQARPTPDEWEKFAATLRATFKTAPCQGWQLYLKYLESFNVNRSAKVEAAKKGLMAFPESDHPTFEPMYYDERVLEPLAKTLGGGDDVIWELLPTILDSQAASKNYYPAAINWAAGKLMKGPESTKRFLKVVGASAIKAKRDLDYAGMICTAAAAGDLTMFRQVYTLMDKISPKLAPKTTGKAWPTEDYGGQLLSPDGMMRISKSSGWDTPIRYRNVLAAEDFEGGNGFHTDKEESPFVEVILAGETEVTGLTIVNSGTNGNNGRQVPLEVSLSADAATWTKVWSTNELKDEWKVKLPCPMIAKYVKVGRTAGAKTEVFHLHKVLVYGKKQY